MVDGPNAEEDDLDISSDTESDTSDPAVPSTLPCLIKFCLDILLVTANAMRPETTYVPTRHKSSSMFPKPERKELMMIGINWETL